MRGLVLGHCRRSAILPVAGKRKRASFDSKPKTISFDENQFGGDAEKPSQLHQAAGRRVLFGSRDRHTARTGQPAPNFPAPDGQRQRVDNELVCPLDIESPVRFKRGVSMSGRWRLSKRGVDSSVRQKRRESDGKRRH